jgi:hypothetical protein
VPGLKQDEFLLNMRKEIDEKIDLVMNDSEKFKEFIMDISIKFAKEIKKRKLK